MAAELTKAMELMRQELKRDNSVLMNELFTSINASNQLNQDQKRPRFYEMYFYSYISSNNCD